MSVKQDSEVYSQNVQPSDCLDSDYEPTHRERNVNDRIHDEIRSSQNIGPIAEGRLTRAKARRASYVPVFRGLSYKGRLDKAMVSKCSVSTSDIPRHFKEAQSSIHWNCWLEAIESEVLSFEENQTWELVSYRKGVRRVGSQSVFSVKLDQSGNVTRWKARLVAQGFSQRPGVDFIETYAPVVGLNTVRLFLSLVCSRRMFLKQLDVKTAYLKGDIDTDIFMRPPEGVNIPEGFVCKI